MKLLYKIIVVILHGTRLIPVTNKYFDTCFWNRSLQMSFQYNCRGIFRLIRIVKTTTSDILWMNVFNVHNQTHQFFSVSESDRKLSNHTFKSIWIYLNVWCGCHDNPVFKASKYSYVQWYIQVSLTAKVQMLNARVHNHLINMKHWIDCGMYFKIQKSLRCIIIPTLAFKKYPRIDSQYTCYSLNKALI